MFRQLSWILLCAAALPAAAAEPLPLDAFVQTVVRNNPGLQAERQNAAAAAEGAKAAGSFMDPMLSYAVAPVMLAKGDAAYAQQIEIEQPLAWTGKRALERSAMEQEAAMKRVGTQAKAQQLATQARMLYGERIILAIDHEALHDELDQLDELRRSTLASIASGMGSQSDALMVESEFHMIHEKETANHSDRVALDAQIDALAGDGISERLSFDLPTYAVDVSAEAAFPEIEMSRRAVARAQAERDLAKKSVFPDVAVFAGLNTMWADRNGWLMAGVKLNLPVQRGRRTAEIAQADERAAAATLQVESARWERDGMRRKALAMLDEARSNRALYEQTAIPLAERRLAAARAAYAGGKVPIEAVIEAVRYRITARSMTKKMAVKEFQAYAELAYANGKALDAAGGAQ